jgi:hypothetical protein
MKFIEVKWRLETCLFFVALLVFSLGLESSSFDKHCQSYRRLSFDFYAFSEDASTSDPAIDVASVVADLKPLALNCLD